MTKEIKLSSVPDTEVTEVVSNLKERGATEMKLKTHTAGGLWTVQATLPDNDIGGPPEGTPPAADGGGSRDLP